MLDPKNFQRPESSSNSRVGSDFESVAKELLDSYGLRLEKDFSLPVGVCSKSKEHRFDLGSLEPKVIVECKSHRWTTGNNVPSAKMTVWNEAMYYFFLAPEDYRKILFVLRDYSYKKGETLAAYYWRTYGHLVPQGVEIWEYDEGTRKAIVWEEIAEDR